MTTFVPIGSGAEVVAVDEIRRCRKGGRRFSFVKVLCWVVGRRLEPGWWLTIEVAGDGVAKSPAGGYEVVAGEGGGVAVGNAGWGRWRRSPVLKDDHGAGDTRPSVVMSLPSSQFLDRDSLLHLCVL